MTIFKMTFKTGGAKAAVFLACVCMLALAGCKREKAAELAYNGAPLDPMCVMAAAEPEGVDLKACTGSAGKDEYTQVENGLETFENGSVGYTFKCEGGCMRPPFVAYKSVGTTKDGEFVLSVETSGGGTGVFSDVRLARIEGDLLKQKILNGGDRCNGGISSASVKGGKAAFSQYVTPFDLVDMSGGNTADFEAYDDISACAACCVGTANFENDVLVGVTLSADAVDNPAEQGYSPVDTCFYGVYNDVVRAGNKQLDVEAMNEFGAQFAARCSELKTRHTAQLP